MSKLKDQVLLLICGIGGFLIAWLIHQGLGDWAPLVFLAVMLFSTVRENRQLRDENRRLRARLPDEPPAPGL
ncbi:hypothetical protein [Pseudomonas sp. RIT-PI-AD]|uniref:hypothetical protein n=1 Tax=Pseudomonas sp. RIT-PI-AD TaxID=3035294 RepID=UPI0021DB502F|nr:hypothetical protein [Pseudomonas sp. RIT-PI-AD]